MLISPSHITPVSVLRIPRQMIISINSSRHCWLHISVKRSISLFLCCKNPKEKLSEIFSMHTLFHCNQRYIFVFIYNNVKDAFSGDIFRYCRRDKRIRQDCSKDDIVVFQGSTVSLPYGIPAFTVEIFNTMCLGL